MSAGKRAAPDEEPEIYRLEWECCCCLGRLGITPGLVPCLNTKCAVHNVCLACSRVLPPVNGVKLCPMCRVPCGQFLPLLALVDKAKDPVAASTLDSKPAERQYDDDSLWSLRARHLRERLAAQTTPALSRTIWNTVVPAFDRPFFTVNDAGACQDVTERERMLDITKRTIAIVACLYPALRLSAPDTCVNGLLMYMVIKIEPVRGPSPAPLPAPRREPWDSPRLYALRKEFLEKMIFEFLQRRAKMDMPLNPGDEYEIGETIEPEFERESSWVLFGATLARAQHFDTVTHRTIQLVTGYPELRLTALRALPSRGPRRPIYMHVGISLRPGITTSVHRVPVPPMPEPAQPVPAPAQPVPEAVPAPAQPVPEAVPEPAQPLPAPLPALTPAGMVVRRYLDFVAQIQAAVERQPPE